MHLQQIQYWPWSRIFHAVKRNLTELTTKSGCVPSRVCGISFAQVPMHLPMSKFHHAQQCFVRHLCQCMQQGSALPCITGKCCLFMHLCQCMCGASIGKPVPSAVWCCSHACGSLMVVGAPVNTRAQFLGPPPLPSKTSGSVFFPIQTCDPVYNIIVYKLWEKA